MAADDGVAVGQALRTAGIFEKAADVVVGDLPDDGTGGIHFDDLVALLLVSPEYNSSLPALLKNTLDWISRPEGDLGVAVAYRGKVAALASASPSALGGLRGLVALRSMLGNIGVTVLPDQVTLGQAQAAFAADGTISDARKRSQAEALGRRLVEVTAKLKG